MVSTLLFQLRGLGRDGWSPLVQSLAVVLDRLPLQRQQGDCPFIEVVHVVASLVSKFDQASVREMYLWELIPNELIGSTAGLRANGSVLPRMPLILGQIWLVGQG